MQSRLVRTVLFFSSTLVTLFQRDYVNRLREALGAPRVPQLLAEPERQEIPDMDSLVMGDVLVDRHDDLFFFVGAYQGSKEQCVLLALETGVATMGIPLSEVSLIKRIDTAKQRDIFEADTRWAFKCLQFYGNHVLLYSYAHNIAFVAPREKTPEFIRNEFKERIRQRTEKRLIQNETEALNELKAKSQEDAVLSPDTVTWQDALIETQFFADLFTVSDEPPSDELTSRRLRFIQSCLIPHFKANRPLSLSSVKVLVESAKKVFMASQRIHYVRIHEKEEMVVVGDIHGQFPDLLTIFRINGAPSKKLKYLFNGDIVDRGDYSCSCLFLLLALKVALPDHFFINRGNHEAIHCGREKFYNELKCIYDSEDELYWQIQDMFQFMPTAHVINKVAFVVHGGIPDNLDIQAYNSIPREESGDLYLINDDEYAMLWHDPSELPGMTENPHRGATVRCFGPDVTESFLNRYDFQVLIRSHSFIYEGFMTQHNGRCWTVFSAPNYCGGANNLAALVILTTTEERLTTKVIYFSNK